MGHKFETKFPRAAAFMKNAAAANTFHLRSEPGTNYALNRITLASSPRLNSMIKRKDHSAVIQDLAKTLKRTAPFDGQADLAMMFGIDNRIKVSAREIVRPNVQWESLVDSIMSDKKLDKDEQLSELFFISKLIWWRILESKNVIDEVSRGGITEAIQIQRAEADRVMDLRLFALFDKIDDFVKRNFGEEIPRPTYPGRPARAAESPGSQTNNAQLPEDNK